MNAETLALQLERALTGADRAPARVLLLFDDGKVCDVHTAEVWPDVAAVPGAQPGDLYLWLDSEV